VNTARVDVEQDGKTRTVHHEVLGDPFTRLATPGAVHSTVGFTVGMGENYGALKISAHVTLTCDQNEPTLNKAGEMSFRKTLELMKDGWENLTQEVQR